MNPKENETIFVTYMYPKCCKWKVKTKEIKQSELEEYERTYRILYVLNYDEREELTRE